MLFIFFLQNLFFLFLFFKNKVIGTHGQGVRVLGPRELTTEHLTEANLRLEVLLRSSASLHLEEPLLGLPSFQLEESLDGSQVSDMHLNAASIYLRKVKV